MSSSEILVNMNHKAMNLLQQDANKIEKLIQVQMETLTNRRCPLYEEVLDTQIYGLSREIDFAVRAGLVDPEIGRVILSKLEQNLAELYEALKQNENE